MTTTELDTHLRAVNLPPRDVASDETLLNFSAHRLYLFRFCPRIAVTVEDTRDARIYALTVV